MPKHYQNSLTDMEEKIHDIWQNVLGVKSKIDINENFINIGGDSLRAMKLYSEINEAYPNILKTSDIFLYPTIKKIAKKIDENTKKNK
jgi:acyl carrier protein